MRQWLAANAEGVVFALALLALTIGCGLAWLPLGLIVPAVLVLTALIWKHLRGD